MRVKKRCRPFERQLWRVLAAALIGANGRLKTGRQKINRPASGLKVYPVRQRQGVVKIDTEVSCCAAHLGVAQQKLNRPQVAGFLVDLRHLRPAHRMGPIGAWLKPYRHNPFAQDDGTAARQS